MADIINPADKLSEKQSEYMKLIAEVWKLEKERRKTARFCRTYGCQQNVADSEKIKRYACSSRALIC